MSYSNNYISWSAHSIWKIKLKYADILSVMLMHKYCQNMAKLQQIANFSNLKILFDDKLRKVYKLYQY